MGRARMVVRTGEYGERNTIFSNGKFQLEGGGRWGDATRVEKTRITPETTRRETTERDSNREYISRGVSEFGQTRSGRRIDYSASFSAADILRNRYASCMRAEHHSQRATKPPPTRCVCIRETRRHRNTRLGGLQSNPSAVSVRNGRTTMGRRFRVRVMDGLWFLPLPPESIPEPYAV